MKRILIALMIVSLTFVSLIGCSSSEDASQKSEEDLRAEVQAELDAERAAEAEARAELEAQIRAELEAEQKKEEPASQQPAQQPAQATQPTQPAQQNQPEPAQPKPVVPNLTGFTNETIKGKTINHSNHTAVIIPNYLYYGANANALSRRPFKTGVAEGWEPPVVPVAFFGKAENVQVTHNTIDLIPPYEEEPYLIWDIGTLENTILDVQFLVASERDSYVITGKVKTSTGAYSDFKFRIGHIAVEDGFIFHVEDDVILFN
ncbi:hypothetical protein [Desulfuribacillus alkaliarsenatis]|uniref:Lipoprotein n=1 Tax=Desulfuribacillus alkaliarsenatis TaxID=766136 RepID=A0A1E5G216_9FIRM|nr:hypothetical protein [Desulfuribacillus alkaliarsenatis]OEF96984.1 hypothetical protein BHF68_05105 [Desulfuribacillus alkaliarsenatis]